MQQILGGIKKNKIQRLKSKEQGRDIVILGNGPSLYDMDFSKLKDPVYVGLNGSALFSSEAGIYEEYYVLSDLRFVKDPLKMKILEDNLRSDALLVVRRELSGYFASDFTREVCSVRSLGRDGFSFDLARGFYFGCTTVMLAIQLASFLGAKNIFLCGVDLRYDPEKPRFYKEDKIHAIDDFSCVQIHNIRNSYKELKPKGISLYNCSENSLLRPYLPYYEL
ncbi:MAG: hypothetical protein COB51_00710 [Moraxellaceae bacterium]|nr:MAG: hypothetical protein COB51_00710 [Moraxellaceae bacterium]